jgi:XisI protein
MDRLERYRKIVRQVLAEYASFKPSHGEIDTELVVDPERDHYEVIDVGWDGDERVHGSIIHIDVIDGKVWIQYDGTDRPVADELIAAGIPQQDIVLAWHPRELRHHTGFAVG